MNRGASRAPARMTADSYHVSNSPRSGWPPAGASFGAQKTPLIAGLSFGVAQSHLPIRDRLTSRWSLAPSMYSRCDGDQKNAAGAVSFFGQRPAFFWTAICVFVLWDRNQSRLGAIP